MLLHMVAAQSRSFTQVWSRSYTKKQIIKGRLLHFVSSGLALGGLLILSRLAAGRRVARGVVGGGRGHFDGVLVTEVPDSV